MKTLQEENPLRVEALDGNGKVFQRSHVVADEEANLKSSVIPNAMSLSPIKSFFSQTLLATAWPQIFLDTLLMRHRNYKHIPPTTTLPTQSLYFLFDQML